MNPALRDAPRSYEDLCIEVAELRGQLKTAKATAAHQYRKPLEDAKAEIFRLTEELKKARGEQLTGYPRTYSREEVEATLLEQRKATLKCFDALREIPRKARKRRQWREEARFAILDARRHI